MKKKIKQLHWCVSHVAVLNSVFLVLSTNLDVLFQAILVLAEPCAFFTLYSVISRCSFKPFQLDRDGSISGLSAEAMCLEIHRILENKSCILASHAQIPQSLTPDTFQLVVEYSESSTPHNLNKHFRKRIMLRSQNPLPDIQMWPLKPPEVSELQRTGPEYGQQQHKQDENSLPVPVAINDHEHCLFNKRRGLNESVLRFENHGALIVSRSLGMVDAAFPPSTAFCVWEIASCPMDPEVCSALAPLQTIE